MAKECLGCPMLRFLKNLAMVKDCWKKWNTESFGKLNHCVAMLRTWLKQSRNLVENGSLEAIDQKTIIRNPLNEALRMEEVVW